MLSKQLSETIEGYENYIQLNGITEDVVDAYVQASMVAMKTENGHKYALEVTKRAKALIEDLVLNLKRLMKIPGLPTSVWARMKTILICTTAL